MAKDKVVGITIDIEGRNSGLTKSLTEINKDLSVVNASLKDVNKALELDPSNLELAAQKSELLTKAISETEEKLKVLEQVAEDAKKGLEAGTVSREQYASLAAEIVKTNATLNDLKSEAEGAGESMEEVGEGAEEASDNLEEVDENSEKAGKGMDALKGAAIATGAALAAAFAAAVEAAKEVGAALVDMTVSTGDYVDQLHTLESTTGISTETLQELNYMAGLVDVSVETITGSMTKLEKSMASADAADAKYYETLEQLDEKLKSGKISQEDYNKAVEEALDKSTTAYDNLGVSIRDANGNLRDNEDVFWDVIDALGTVENSTEKDLLAMELLGKSAKELNPLIAEGSAGFREYAAEAKEVGFVMDEQDLSKYQEFDDQMERLNKASQAAKQGLGMILLPSLNSLATTGTGLLQKFSVGLQKADGDIGKIGDLISELLPELFDEINKQLPAMTGLISDVVMTLVQILIDNLPMLLDAALQIVTTLADGLLAPENLAKIIQAATDIILKITEYLINNLGTIMDAAIQIIVTVVNGLAEATPKLIPAIVDAVLTIVDTLIENLPLLLDAGMQLLIGITTGLLDALPQLLERLPEIISGIVEFLLSPEGIGKMVTTGFDLLVAIVSDLPNITLKILEAIGQLIFDMVENIGKVGVQVFDAMREMFPSLDDVMSWGSDMIHGIIDGITGALGDLWDACTDVASGIADFLGFSVPSKGPLHAWAYANPGADMVKLWSEGVEDELPELESTLNLMAGTIAGSSSPDYSGQMSSIDANLAAIAGAERTTIVPVYIGDERLGTAVARANIVNNWISGGR